MMTPSRKRTAAQWLGVAVVAVLFFVVLGLGLWLIYQWSHALGSTLLTGLGGAGVVLLTTVTNQFFQIRREDRAYERSKETNADQNAQALRLADKANEQALKLADKAAEVAREAAHADDTRHLRDQKIQRLQAVYADTMRWLLAMSTVIMTIHDYRVAHPTDDWAVFARTRLDAVGEALLKANASRALEPGEPRVVKDKITAVWTFYNVTIQSALTAMNLLSAADVLALHYHVNSLIDDVELSIQAYIESIDRPI